MAAAFFAETISLQRSCAGSTPLTDEQCCMDNCGTDSGIVFTLATQSDVPFVPWRPGGQPLPEYPECSRTCSSSQPQESVGSNAPDRRRIVPPLLNLPPWPEPP